jgi:hypothetical protein
MPQKEFTPALISDFNSAAHVGGQPLTAAEVGKFDNNASVIAALPASISATDKVSMTLNDEIYAARHKVTAWSATSFSLGDVVSHLGSFWYASTAAISTDVPGTASLWKKTGAPYIS